MEQSSRVYEVLIVGSRFPVRRSIWDIYSDLSYLQRDYHWTLATVGAQLGIFYRIL